MCMIISIFALRRVIRTLNAQKGRIEKKNKKKSEIKNNTKKLKIIVKNVKYCVCFKSDLFRFHHRIIFVNGFTSLHNINTSFILYLHLLKVIHWKHSVDMIMVMQFERLISSKPLTYDLAYDMNLKGLIYQWQKWIYKKKKNHTNRKLSKLCFSSKSLIRTNRTD